MSTASLYMLTIPVYGRTFNVTDAVNCMSLMNRRSFRTVSDSKKMVGLVLP